MKISTRGRYAARAVMYMAKHGADAPIPLSEISREQYLSVKYLERIMSDLIKAGLVKGRKGKGGGFMLARKPSDITLSDILGATENAMLQMECTYGGKDCRLIDRCYMKKVWKDFGEYVRKYLEEITVEGLVNGQSDIEKNISARTKSGKRA